MSSTSRDSRQTTTQRPDPLSEAKASETHHDHSLVEEIRELPHEVAEVAEHALDEIEDSAIGRWAVGAYVWLLDKAPSSTRGRVLLTAFIFVIVLIPSGALLYFTWGAEDSTETWFGDLGYLGVFLANMASTGTLFIPVPGLTAAAQALIVSSAASLNPIGVGVLGGLGMAIGEITAYVAGMAAAVIVREEEIKAPSRLPAPRRQDRPRHYVAHDTLRSADHFHALSRAKSGVRAGRLVGRRYALLVPALHGRGRERFGAEGADARLPRRARHLRLGQLRRVRLLQLERRVQRAHRVLNLAGLDDAGDANLAGRNHLDVDARVR